MAATVAGAAARMASVDRLRRVIAWTALVLAVVVLLADPIRPWWHNNTDAHAYGETAYSLAHGDGYRMLDGEMERYPPGWTVILAPVSLVGEWPGNVQAFTRLTGVLLLVLVWAAAKRTGGWEAATVAALLCAGSVQMLEHSRQVISDVPAACLLVGAFLATTYGRRMLAGFLVGYSVAMRLASALFLPAVFNRRGVIGAAIVGVPLVIFHLAVYGKLTGYGQGEGGFALSHFAGDVHHAVIRGEVTGDPSWLFYLKVLGGWGGWLLPGVAPLGMWEMWRRRSDEAARFALIATVTGFGFCFLSAQSPRYMLVPSAFLIVYAAAAVVRLGRLGEPDAEKPDVVAEGVGGISTKPRHTERRELAGAGH